MIYDGIFCVGLLLLRLHKKTLALAIACDDDRCCVEKRFQVVFAAATAGILLSLVGKGLIPFISPLGGERKRLLKKKTEDRPPCNCNKLAIFYHQQTTNSNQQFLLEI
jgi:hypothetical protein